jgi:hypothetical protein
MVVLALTMMLLAVATPLVAGTVPAGANLDQFPIMSGPLSAGQMADMGLRPTRLAITTDFLNYNRARNVFELTTVNAGEVVLVDIDGIMRYKASCGNRLATLTPEPRPLDPLPPSQVCQEQHVPWTISLAWWLGDLSFWGCLGFIALVLLLFMASMAAGGLIIALSHPHHHTRYGWCHRCDRHHWFYD